MIKILNSLLLSFLLVLQGTGLSGIAYAQQQQAGDSQQGVWYDITDFSKGLQSHISPFMTPKGAFTDALNVRFNLKYGAVAKRPKRLLLSQCKAAPVKSIYRFYKSDGTKFTIQTSSTYLDYVDDSSGACTDLLSTLTDGKRWTWVTYKDIAVGTNGTDHPIKWDGLLLTTDDTTGARTAGDSATQLGAAFAQLNTGTDLNTGEWYQYKVAFYDGEVYKFSNARSNPLKTGATVYDISLSDIPLGPIGTTERIIYRTLGQSSRAAVVSDSTFYQVAVIADNSSRTYTDTTPDATISGDASPTWADVSAGIESTPPYSKLSLIHNERLFFANDPSGITGGKSTIYWSDLFNPDYFTTATDFQLVRPDDGDEITAILNLVNILTVGKQNSWQKYYTDTPATSGWTLSDPFDTFGCVAMYSAVNGTGGVYGGGAIYYLSRYGIRTFNGQSSQLISDVVTDKVRDMQPINLDDVVGVFQDNQYILSYTSTAGGSAFNDSALVLDLTRNSYALDAVNIDSFAVFSSSTDNGILYSGSSLTDGSIYAHSGSFSELINRYKSDLDAGTFTNSQSNGTEDASTLSLGSTETWADDTSTWGSESVSTWLVQASPGTWVSPIIQINASQLNKLYWNEQLGSFGNITFALRTASSAMGISSASWSSEFTTPSGSDVSGVPANSYIQIRVTMTTSNFTETPYLFLDDDFIFKLDYSKNGTTGETSILSFLQTGYTDLDAPNHPKRITQIQIHYTGTLGTMNIGVTDDNNVMNLNFPIDLSIDPTSSSKDQYFGNKVDKIYTYFPSVKDQVMGRKFRFTVTENGNTDWQIKKIAVQFDADPVTPYR